MYRFATFTVTTIAIAVISAAPAGAIPVPPDQPVGATEVRSAAAGSVSQADRSEHRMPFLFRVNFDY